MNSERAVNKNPKLENLKPFKPGQSGNPKGAPKGIPELNTLLSNIKEDDYQKMIDKMVELAKKGNVRAFEVIAERVFGKVKEKIEISGTVKSYKIVPASSRRTND